MGKWYTVLVGRHTGVFSSWDECKEYVDGYPGAKYKAYASQADAIAAYRRGNGDDNEIVRQIIMHSTPARANYESIPGVVVDSIAVDASCLGNPGVMEYQGVSVATGATLFRVGPFQDATNNIGEFLALIHVLAMLDKQGDTTTTVYSDSKTALAWLRTRQVKTTLRPTPRNAKVLELLRRAQLWLSTHAVKNPVKKWNTEEWGEIPADFGRK